jgi:NADH-quinone oxidoreductase subunit K
MSLASSSINLMHLLLLSGALISIGIWGVLINKDSPISVFISLQIIFIAIVLSLISFSVGLKDLNIRVFSLFVSIVMVVEFMIGLSILFIFYRGNQK